MSRTPLRAGLALLPLAVLCGGCLAVGQAFDLASVALTLAVSGTGTIAIAAWDRREWILAGARPQSFAGKLRGGFGNPFDVKIRGDLPLAHVTADAIAKGLSAKGFRASTVKIDPQSTEIAAVSALQATGAEKLLLVDIQKWQSDTYMQVGMHYQLVLQVLDGAGNVVAQARVTGAENGMDNLKGSFWNPAKRLRRC